MLKQVKILLLIMILLLPLSVFAANPAAMLVFDGSGSMWLEIEGTPKIELLAPPGSSCAEITNAVASIIDPRGNTPLAQSIKFAAEPLKGRESSASIIVISDGKESCNADPCKVAETINAAGMNIKVHVVGFDVKQDEAEQLRCIASNGGGKYFPANNASELSRSFAEVKKEVVQNQRVYSVMILMKSLCRKAGRL